MTKSEAIEIARKALKQQHAALEPEPIQICTCVIAETYRMLGRWIERKDYNEHRNRHTTERRKAKAC